MKKVFIGMTVVLFLLAGVFFVSADFSEKEEVEVDDTQYEECGPNTCNGQCGGGCGVPTCGCSR